MKILVVHTGGTIGMASTPDGFAPAPRIVEDALADMVGANEIGAQVDVILLQPLIDSAHSEPEDWNRIAQAVFDARARYDGFVVTHGTDTLAYTASALCLALQGLERPVILTGAMMPLTVAGNDGHVNLRDACNAATQAHPGIWVQFAGKLLHGARVRKSHSSALDAFEASPAAAAPLWLSDEPHLNQALGHKVGLFSVTPGTFTGMLDFAARNCDGILLRCYGSGTAPDTAEFRKALELAQTRKVPVIAVSQCPEGGLRFGTYAAGRVMRDTGVVDGRDISAEMAYSKLQFALSLHSSFDARLAFLRSDQCGEMTPEIVSP